MTQRELEDKLIELWGATVKPFNPPSGSRLSDNINLSDLSDQSLISLLDILLKSSASDMSGFSVDYDNYDILQVVKEKLSSIHSTSRRLFPVLRCYEILLNHSTSTEGLLPLATMYLISEIEYSLKLRSKYLDDKGIISKEIPTSLSRRLSSSQRRVGKRISQIGDVIKIYCYRNNSPFSIYLKSYDKTTKQYIKILLKGHYNVTNGKRKKARYTHTALIETVNESRNSIMHGEKSYLGTLIFLFLTLHAIFFLNHQDMYQGY